jgi:hypothetical protein
MKLLKSIDAADNEIQVAYDSEDELRPQPGDILAIEQELLYVTDVTGDTRQVVRGILARTNEMNTRGHASGTTVQIVMRPGAKLEKE